MKKFIAMLLLAAAVTLTFTACGGDSAEDQIEDAMEDAMDELEDLMG